MPLGSKWDYVHGNNLRPPRIANVAKSILFPKRGRLSYYPRRYSIEPTTSCNLKCRHCFHWKYDPAVHLKREQMSFEHFELILGKIKDYALLIEFYNFGEPFLNRETPRMIAAATNAGIRSRISSNMNAPMTDDYARQVVEAGLYRLTCSIDGPSQEIYEKYRQGGDLAKALENADKILFYKKKLGAKYPIVVFRMLVFEWNAHCINDAAALALAHGFDEFHADPGTYDIAGEKMCWDIQGGTWRKGKTKFLSQTPPKAQVPCEWLFNGIIINANGNVMPCCFSDVQKAEHLSLLTNSLDAVWNSEAYIATRRYTLGLSTDRDSVLPLCRECRLL